MKALIEKYEAEISALAEYECVLRRRLAHTKDTETRKQLERRISVLYEERCELAVSAARMRRHLAPKPQPPSLRGGDAAC